MFVFLIDSVFVFRFHDDSMFVFLIDSVFVFRFHDDSVFVFRFYIHSLFDSGAMVAQYAANNSSEETPEDKDAVYYDSLNTWVSAYKMFSFYY